MFFIGLCLRQSFARNLLGNNSGLFSCPAILPYVSGHVEDDYNATVTRSTGRYREVPPEGGSGITRVMAMLQEVVRCASRLLDIVANDSDEEADQAIVEDGAVDKVGED